MVNKTMNTNITHEQINEQFKQIPTTRKQNREQLIKSICKTFIQLCKERQLLSFPREHLNFFCDGLMSRTQQRITTAIINELKQENLIREDTRVKAIYSIDKKPLLSFDYGSYNILMAKNGYKRNLYKYSKNPNEPPKRTKTKTLEIGDGVKNCGCDFDYSDITSNKPQDAQAVYTNGSKTWVKHLCGYSEKTVYTIL